MALINNNYIFVEEETINVNVRVSEHPVEKGAPVTDNIRKEPVTIQIKGEIVGKNAKSVLDKLKGYSEKGTLVKYIGCRTLNNALLLDVKGSFSSKIKGGCTFSAEVREFRIAKSPYKAPAKSPGKKTPSAGTQQVQAKPKPKRYYTVKPGDCLWNIAKSYYGDGAKYTKIYNANRNIIKNPDLIYDGQKILIPY